VIPGHETLSKQRLYLVFPATGPVPGGRFYQLDSIYAPLYQAAKVRTIVVVTRAGYVDLECLR
jgi:hypothetical protein